MQVTGIGADRQNLEMADTSYIDSKKSWIPLTGAFFVQLLVTGTEKAFSVWFVEIQYIYQASASATSGIAGINSTMRLLLAPLAVMLTSIFGLQFAQYRSIALSISVTGAGFGAFILPHLVSFLEETYAYDGAMLMNAAIMFHLSIFGALFFPIPSDKPQDTEKTRAVAWKEFKQKLNWVEMLKDKWFMIFASGFIFNMMGSGPVTTLIVDYCLFLKITKNQAILLLSLEGIFQAVIRLSSGFIFSIKQVQNIRGYIWSASIFISSLAILAMCIVKDFITFALIMCVRGCFLALYIAQQTLITADMAEVIHDKKVNQAVGIAQFMKGIGTLIGSFLSGEFVVCFGLTFISLGYIKDYTGSYAPAFLFLGSMHMIGSILSCISVFVRNRQIKKFLAEEIEIKPEESEQSQTNVLEISRTSIPNDQKLKTSVLC
ncbi:hypothetical protein Ciccas_008048 [Cichlidogyrus casuarinus]|uniref:Uncharacterized protein n=1 Tax=Cichlidogyrus casuarinus TaxID=1844966 RepID=A0ABD2Q135_9PLAT